MIENKVESILRKSGFKILKTPYNDKDIDFLVSTDQCVFALQIKSKPLESFDIISGSTITAGTISTSIKENPAFQNKEVVPVLVSGSIVTDSSKTFGDELGVVVTDYVKIAESLDTACKKPKKE